MGDGKEFYQVSDVRFVYASVLFGSKTCDCLH